MQKCGDDLRGAVKKQCQTKCDCNSRRKWAIHHFYSRIRWAHSWNPRKHHHLFVSVWQLSFHKALCIQIFKERMPLSFHYKQLCLEHVPSWRFFSVRTDAFLHNLAALKEGDGKMSHVAVNIIVVLSLQVLVSSAASLWPEMNCDIVQIGWRNSGIVYISCALVIPITKEEFTRWLPNTTQNTWIEQEALIN